LRGIISKLAWFENPGAGQNHFVDAVKAVKQLEKSQKKMRKLDGNIYAYINSLSKEGL
jgi:hypothetical protein